MKIGSDYIGVGVAAIILNSQNHIFLSHRGHGARHETDCWEIPGGEVELHEPLNEAVRREVKEEFGVEIELLQQLPAVDHIHPQTHQHWVSTTFLARLKPGQTPSIQEPQKCSDFGWFSPSDLPAPISQITRSDIACYLHIVTTGALHA